MKNFILHLLKFLIPFLVVILIVSYVDFFKIWGFQDDYYQQNKVELNREMVCTKTYNHHRKIENFNSFIFGNSRSQAYKCGKWSTYLDKDSKAFIFDGSGEGIWGISKKAEYLDELGDTIRNALLVLDRTLLKTTKMNEGHIAIPMPVVSKSSYSKYYLTFLEASLDPKFIISYIDYSIFRKYRKYMKLFIVRDEIKPKFNPINCDYSPGYDEVIRVDSIGYYKKLINNGEFYDRPVEKKWKCEITDLEIEQLKSIKNIFSKHNTKYTIIISPAYDQIPLEDEQLELLNKIFGKENIFNFSGKNKYTENISNHYESWHYKPIVANDIMRIIYTQLKE